MSSVTAMIPCNISPIRLSMVYGFITGLYSKSRSMKLSKTPKVPGSDGLGFLVFRK